MRKNSFFKSKQQFNILINCKITRLWRNTCDFKEPLCGCCHSNLLFHQLYLIILLILIPAKGWKRWQVSPVFFMSIMQYSPFSQNPASSYKTISIRPRDTWRYFKGFSQGLVTAHLRRYECSVISGEHREGT